MLALASALGDRGHRVTFLHQSDAAALFEGAPVDFVPLGAGTHPPGHLARVRDHLGKASGPLGIFRVIRDVAAATAMLVDELPRACERLAVDVIVADQTEAAGGLVARHLRLPFVSVANALPLNREPGIPPPFTGWRYDASEWGRERNKGGYRVSDFLMHPHARVIAAAAAHWQLGPLLTMEDCASPFAQISQTVGPFDLPRSDPPPTFHHVGPLRANRRPLGGFRMPPRDGRPLVYASLGTLQGDRLALFRTIAAAAKRLNAQLILTHAGMLSPTEAASLAGAQVFDFVPQSEVLAHADLAVLHGGLNTVMDALAAGVPIVCIPIAFEQAAIAARIVHAGAGLRVRRRFLSASHLGETMRRVLTERRFREAAGRLSAAIAAAGGVERAADIVEAVLRTREPVLSLAREAMPCATVAAA